MVLHQATSLQLVDACTCVYKPVDLVGRASNSALTLGSSKPCSQQQAHAGVTIQPLMSTHQYAKVHHDGWQEARSKQDALSSGGTTASENQLECSTVALVCAAHMKILRKACARSAGACNCYVSTLSAPCGSN
jgi:hypothetical protein